VTVTEGSFISERTTLEILKQGQYAVIDKYEIQNKLGLASEFRDMCSAPSCYAEMSFHGPSNIRFPPPCSDRPLNWPTRYRRFSRNFSICRLRFPLPQAALPNQCMFPNPFPSP
jgi:hypothetical protein